MFTFPNVVKGGLVWMGICAEFPLKSIFFIVTCLIDLFADRFSKKEKKKNLFALCEGNKVILTNKLTYLKYYLLRPNITISFLLTFDRLR